MVRSLSSTRRTRRRSPAVPVVPASTAVTARTVAAATAQRAATAALAAENRARHAVEETAAQAREDQMVAAGLVTSLGAALYGLSRWTTPKKRTRTHREASSEVRQTKKRREADVEEEDDDERTLATKNQVSTVLRGQW